MSTPKIFFLFFYGPPLKKTYVRQTYSFSNFLTGKSNQLLLIDVKFQNFAKPHKHVSYTLVAKTHATDIYIRAIVRKSEKMITLRIDKNRKIQQYRSWPF